MSTNTITPWGLLAGLDISASETLAIMYGNNYTFTIHNTGNSLFIVANWPGGQQMAFRATFAMNDVFEVTRLKNIDAHLEIHLKTRLGHYKVTVSFPDLEQSLFRYTTIFTPAADMLIPYCPRDIMPLTKDGNVLNTSAAIHMHQVGTRSGALYFSTTKPRYGSVFYFQNLSDISAFCDATETSLSETVGGSWPELGFRIPSVIKKPLPGGKDYIISDAFVVLSEETPADDVSIAKQYLNHLASVYSVIPKPETKYNDWPDISKKALADLTFNKGCWTYTKGHAYLNAYLCDYKTPAEIMVQLSVLYAITEYAQWTGESYPVVDEIKGGLPAFYDDKLKTISRWLPSQRGELDEAEEQKKAMTMDSWYLHHPLTNLSKLALGGDDEAKELLLKSIEYSIKVAHHFNYEWPVFYKMDTLETLKAETVPGKGGEKDVAGGYAHLMVNVWKLTGDKRYLDEALTAGRKLLDMGMDVFYQANNTAFSALAMLRLYKETKEELFLDVSYLCIAGIMKNVQLWECNYGNAVNFDNFFGIFPLNDAPYKAAYEEMEVYAALNDYIKEAVAIKAPILSAVMLLLPELIRYSVSRLPCYYPPLLPEDILSEEVKTGEVDPRLWIPVEDLQDGWEKHGQVGQEVYGAGVGFGVIPRQYIKIENAGFMIFTEHPVTRPVKHKNNSLSFTIIAGERFTSKLILLDNGKHQLNKIRVVHNLGDEDTTLKPSKKLTELIEYNVTGGQKITVHWS